MSSLNFADPITMDDGFNSSDIQIEDMNIAIKEKHNPETDDWTNISTDDYHHMYDYLNCNEIIQLKYEFGNENERKNIMSYFGQVITKLENHIHALNSQKESMSRMKKLRSKKQTSSSELDPNQQNLFEDVPEKNLSLITQTSTCERCHSMACKCNKKIDSGLTCQLCQKSFRYRSSLLHHAKIHTGVKDIACGECEAKFYCTGALTRHYKIHHSNEKDFQCSYCSKRFAFRNLLVKHEVVHTGLRNYVCNICDKRFLQYGNLHAHKQCLHMRKKLSCQKCGKKFAISGNLRQHLRTHEKKKNKRAS